MKDESDLEKKLLNRKKLFNISIFSLNLTWIITSNFKFLKQEPANVLA
jgi:hypothetical protein